MSISVKNSANVEIHVAINQWGNDGDTSFFTINPGKSETWDRSNDNGFVMAVKISGTQHPYYVLYNSSIDVRGVDQVYDQGVKIPSLK
jgi:hypothetical protein